MNNDHNAFLTHIALSRMSHNRSIVRRIHKITAPLLFIFYTFIYTVYTYSKHLYVANKNSFSDKKKAMLIASISPRRFHHFLIIKSNESYKV